MVRCGVQCTALSQGLGSCGSSSPCAGLAEWGLHFKAYPSHLDHPAEINGGLLGSSHRVILSAQEV